MYSKSIRYLIPDEMQSPSEWNYRESFDSSIDAKYGLPMTEADFKDNPDYDDFVTPTYDYHEDDEVPASKMLDIDHVGDKYDVDTYDQYVGAQDRVPIGDSICTGKVVRRQRDIDGTAKRLVQ
jgi:hypothetical protein